VRWRVRGGGGGAAGCWRQGPPPPGVVHGAPRAGVVPVMGLGPRVGGVVAEWRGGGGRSVRGQGRAEGGGTSGPNQALEPTAPSGSLGSGGCPCLGAAAHRQRSASNSTCVERRHALLKQQWSLAK